ncbi:MAG: cyclic nucleotide-binding domain-containing protein [Anaerolineae bacterium]|nr:cyclic nucleotide-binding domain-containing protein [Anaerolineae bacterium]
MPDRFVLSNIRRLPLLSRLAPHQLDVFASVTQVLRYEPGETVFQQGEVPPGLFLFISGNGVLTQRGVDGVERIFGQMNSGEYTPEAALFNETPSLMNLRVTQTAIVLFLARQQMRGILAHYPDIQASLQAAQTAAASAPPQPGMVEAFESQRPNENILIQTRKHPYAFIGKALTLMFLTLAVWIGGAYFGSVVPQFPWVLIALPITLLFIVLAAFYFLEWRNDLLVISDRRVVNVHRNILNFSTQINEIPLDGIHEVNVSLPPLSDFGGRLVGYGTIIIKTSGDANNILLTEMPNPKAIQEAIFTHKAKYQEKRAQESRDAQRSAIRGELARVIGGPPTTQPAPGQTRPAGQNAPLPPGVIIRPGPFALKFTDEDGNTVYRKHHVVWFGNVFLPTLVIGSGLVLLLLGIGGLLALAVVALGAFLFYLADWDWRNDLYIVGDETVTIIHRRPLFLQDQKDKILLAQVDNVVSSTQGFVNSLMQIGEVKLMLSGADEKNAKRFTYIYQPKAVQQEIARRQDIFRQNKSQEEAQRQRQAIVEYLSVYHESVGQPPNAYPPNAPAGAPTAYNDSFVQPVDDYTEQPPRVRDRSRPPGVPRARRDSTGGT